MSDPQSSRVAGEVEVHAVDPAASVHARAGEHVGQQRRAPRHVVAVASSGRGVVLERRPISAFTDPGTEAATWRRGCLTRWASDGGRNSSTSRVLAIAAVASRTLRATRLTRHIRVPTPGSRAAPEPVGRASAFPWRCHGGPPVLSVADWSEARGDAWLASAFYPT